MTKKKSNVQPTSQRKRADVKPRREKAALFLASRALSLLTRSVLMPSATFPGSAYARVPSLSEKGKT